MDFFNISFNVTGKYLSIPTFCFFRWSYLLPGRTKLSIFKSRFNILFSNKIAADFTKDNKTKKRTIKFFSQKLQFLLKTFHESQYSILKIFSFTIFYIVTMLFNLHPVNKILNATKNLCSNQK